ncbi:hypothetical protein Dimus_039826 [Dionaea muscipula]
MLTESNDSWIVDSRATQHMTKDRSVYVEYRWIPARNRKIFMGNNTSLDALGIGTCKLDLRGGLTLYLYDVLYAPGIRRILVSVVSLLSLGFKLLFENNGLVLSLDNIVMVMVLLEIILLYWMSLPI